MTILVIDDDSNIRELLRLELSDYGYPVETAENGFDGISKLKRGSIFDGDFKLIILDIKMPGMDGIETLEKIISIVGSKVPVIIHSAYSHYKENYLTWSAVAYIVKGSFDELIETVGALYKIDNPKL